MVVNHQFISLALSRIPTHSVCHSGRVSASTDDNFLLLELRLLLLVLEGVVMYSL